MTPPTGPQPPPRLTRRRRWPWAAGAAAAAAVLALLVWSGVLWPNRLAAAGYEVRGIDVSRYQGTIDWDVLAQQDIGFAYIKATEGSSHVDERFEANWAGATSTSLLVGAYHFMSFESSGETQAQSVVDHVPATPGTLPPVVDLEYYGGYFDDPPTADTVRDILDPLLVGLGQHYGVPPVIYTTEDAYDAYVRDAYPDNPIWIRSVATPPSLPDGREWAFWQYSNRDRLPGYDGAEQYIDLNVFAGALGELEALTIP
ncbi:lysozyme [Antribacter sp. KLBMP9083]|uniref:Lysozyme n=1 Tax=Antribacter soli TaxID=2910976 RepID=A0AA41QEA1_9MICO|nr:GH25 family lysozyme [Antribacter soli]MCF4120537.1 lysozyme [Antribacter soli]